MMKIINKIKKGVNSIVEEGKTIVNDHRGPVDCTVGTINARAYLTKNLIKNKVNEIRYSIK